MKKLIQLMTIAVLALSLVACGKSDEEKAQDKADKLVKEHNALAKELNGMGMPQIWWSESKIDTFENKLNRLESLANQLKNMDGKKGVIIYGGDNSTFIARSRARLSSVREQKVRQASARENKQKFAELNDQNLDITQEISDMGEPDTTWTEDELKRVIEMTSKVLGNIQKQMKIIDDGVYNTTKSYELRRSLRGVKTDVQGIHDKAQGLLSDLRTAGDQASIEIIRTENVA